jgi:addiction module RelE/StbE family toxin
MAQVVWSFQAIADLESIAEYIAKDSEFYAAAFVQEALEAGRSLESLFNRGRIVPEFRKKTTRELFVKEYRLIYHIEATCITVIGIIHMRRLARKIVRGRVVGHK